MITFKQNSWFNNDSNAQQKSIYICAHSSSCSLACSSHRSALHHTTFAPCLCTYFALCLIHTPPFLAWLVHPSLMHLLCFAPCLMYTPPFLARFLHPSLLHSFLALVAPCLMQTPPLRTWFVHPSLVHSLGGTTFAPCRLQTPPF